MQKQTWKKLVFGFLIAAGLVFSIRYASNPVEVQVPPDTWTAWLLANPAEYKTDRMRAAREIVKEKISSGQLDGLIDSLSRQKAEEIAARRAKSIADSMAENLVDREKVARMRAEKESLYVETLRPEEQKALNHRLFRQALGPDLRECDMDSDLPSVADKLLSIRQIRWNEDNADHLYVQYDNGVEQDFYCPPSYWSESTAKALKAVVIEARRLGRLPYEPDSPQVVIK